MAMNKENKITEQLEPTSESKKKYKIKILCFILIIIIGFFLFIYGEIDDSPGGQMIGLLVVFGSFVGIRRAIRYHKS